MSHTFEKNIRIPAYEEIFENHFRYSLDCLKYGKWIDDSDIYYQTFFIDFNSSDNILYNIQNGTDSFEIKQYETSLNSYTVSSINTQNANRGVKVWLPCGDNVISPTNATLLWENSNTSTPFDDQFISIPECSDYNAVLISTKFYYTQGSNKTVYCLGLLNELSASANNASSNASYGSYRTFTMKNNGIEFDKAQGIGSASSAVDDNTQCIPIKVYGLSFSGNKDAIINIPNIEFFFSPQGYFIDSNDNLMSVSDKYFDFVKENNGISISSQDYYKQAYINFIFKTT